MSDANSSSPQQGPPICILGGTFDPIHNAHLAIAHAALDKLGAKSVVWMPTGCPPYRDPPVASAVHRVAMLRLAIAGEPRYTLDGRELAAGATGYTYDTLLAMRAGHPGTPLVLLIGADQFLKFETWHRWRDLLALCRIAVFARPGWEAPSLDCPPDAVIHVSMQPLAISANDIRARIGRGEDVSAMLPPRVLAYIRDQGLYR